MTTVDDLRKLPPEERLARLRKLEEEHRSEIEEAEELMSESRREIREIERRRDIPVDAVTADTMDELFTEEEKQLFETKRFEQRTRPARRSEETGGETEEELEEMAANAPKEEERGVNYGNAIEQSREGPEKMYNPGQEKEPSDIYARNEDAEAGAKYHQDRADEMKEEQETKYAP